jgi:hypothetical protein
MAAAGVLVCLACVLAFSPAAPLAVASVLLGGLATYVLTTPAAALLSGLFPVVSDLSKTGTGGNPHVYAMLAGTVLIVGLALPPAAIHGVVYHVLARPGLALVLMTLWALAASIVAVPLLTQAARAVGQRRENMGMVASGR